MVQSGHVESTGHFGPNRSIHVKNAHIPYNTPVRQSESAAVLLGFWLFRYPDMVSDDSPDKSAMVTNVVPRRPSKTTKIPPALDLYRDTEFALN